jgi:hypothetical protein
MPFMTINYFILLHIPLPSPDRSMHLDVLSNCPTQGRAIAQAVSRWLPIAAVRVRARVWSYGICGGQVALDKVFSEYFGFP